MNIHNIGPIHQNLAPHGYNLRLRQQINRDNQPADNNRNVINENNIPNVDNVLADINNWFFDNMANNPNNANVNNANVNVNNNMDMFKLGLLPKFNGNANENPLFWLQKFENFCGLQGINDDNRKIQLFSAYIAGPCENWFMLLPGNAKDTFAHLRQAFLDRFTGPLNTRADEEIFYTKFQLLNQPVNEYINDMITIGNKLQLDANIMLSTIKRGLLPHIRLHVMSHNADNINSLIQQATLAETFRNALYPSTVQSAMIADGYHNLANQYAGVIQPKVHFELPNNNQNSDSEVIAKITKSNAEVKTAVDNLSRLFENMQINAAQANNSDSKHRPRSPSPFRAKTDDLQTNRNNNNNNNNRSNMELTQFQRPIQPNFYNAPFCNFCKSQGHTYSNCRLRLQIRNTSPNQYSQRFNFQPNRWRPQYGNRPQAPRSPYPINSMAQPDYSFWQEQPQLQQSNQDQMHLN
jgi:hypothetical protein